MKILHLLGGREDLGGIFSVVRSLQESSRPFGWRHHVWVSRGYSETRRPALEYRWSRRLAEDSDSSLAMAFQAARALPELSRLIQSEGYDVVHGHTRLCFLSVQLLSRWLKRPMVFTNHAYARRTGMYRAGARTPRMRTVFLTRNMARHYGVDPGTDRVSLISACFNDAFLQAPLRPPPPRGSDQKVSFVAVGNIVPWKNWHVLAEAAALLSETERARFTVDVWGPTPRDGESQRYDRELRALIEAKGVGGQVRLRGVTDRIREEVERAHWFLLPSRNEPCSVALMEALALGRPALVSRSGGSVDIVEEGVSGAFFETGDPASLAERLRGVLSGTSTCATPERIRETVSHRSATEVAKQYRTLYESIVPRP